MSGLESLFSLCFVKLPPSKIPLSGRFVPPLLSKGPVLGNTESSGKIGLFLSLPVLLSFFFFSLSTLKSILLHFPSCLVAVFPYNSQPTSSLLFFWQNLLACPPFSPSPYSSFLYFFFSLPFLLAQSLNLPEPRDPVCYVNGLNTDTHVLTYCMYTCAAHTKPPFHHTCAHIHTRTVCYMAKLGFAAFGRRSTLSRSPLSLTG